MLNAKHRQLKKGCGFNLDLLVACECMFSVLFGHKANSAPDNNSFFIAILMSVNSFFGLPWMCAAPVRTLAHWASLCVYSKTHVPGEKPQLTTVKEQRITAIFVHFFIGKIPRFSLMTRHKTSAHSFILQVYVFWPGILSKKFRYACYSECFCILALYPCLAHSFMNA
jgi:hypothetical protein